MTNHVGITVSLKPSLQLQLSIVGGETIIAGLTRICAQQVAHVLLEAAGIEEKSISGGRRSVTFAAYDETPMPAAPKKQTPIRLTHAKKRGVIRL